MKPSWVTKLIRQISVATCWPRASSLIQNELKKAHRIARPVCIASKTNPNNHEFHSCYSKESYDQRCRFDRSEEHTSELQSRFDLVCRLLLEKKKNVLGTLQ